MVYEFDGTKHGKLRDMQAARRAKPPDPVHGGTDFTRTAPRSRCVQTPRKGLAQRQDTFHRP
ncbi:hypothetical protein ACLUWS_08955, partial [Bifidobacterium boum]